MRWRRTKWVKQYGPFQSISFLPLNIKREEILVIIGIISEFINKHIDTILNISILLSCLFLYLNINKVLTIKYQSHKDKDVIIKKDNKIYKIIYWIILFISFIYIYLQIFKVYMYLIFSMTPLAEITAWIQEGIELIKLQ